MPPEARAGRSRLSRLPADRGFFGHLSGGRFLPELGGVASVTREADGRWRIARKVARDRVISTVDRQAAIPAIPASQSRSAATIDDFTVDEEADTVTCPNGVTRPMSGIRTVTFGAACAGCPLRERCTTARDGRPMTIHPMRACCAKPAPRPARRSSSRHTRPGRASSGPSAGSPPATAHGLLVRVCSLNTGS